MPKIFLTNEICFRARDKLTESLDAEDGKGVLIQHKAADSSLRACLTQQRYGISPQIPADYTRASRSRNSEAQQHETLSADDLLAFQRQMLGDHYPGSPS